jgi:alkylated DNA repair dioxygenase AlkB
MAPKSRWGKKESKVENKAPPVLPVRRTDLPLEDAVCVQIENCYTIEECQRYMEVLQHELDWKKQGITVPTLDGKLIERKEPRLTLFMSDPGIRYEYSGRDNAGVEWHQAVLEIKEKAERAVVECGLPRTIFNSVQLNRYDGPRHSLGMHADNEPDLVSGAPIASVSFGASRDFRLMRRDDESKNWVLTLADCCFLLMGGDMQTHYLHGVPPGGDHGVRINLTFRVCHPREAGRTEAIAGAIAANVEASGKGNFSRGASSYGKGRGKVSEVSQHTRDGSRSGKGKVKASDFRRDAQDESSDKQDA